MLASLPRSPAARLAQVGRPRPASAGWLSRCAAAALLLAVGRRFGGAAGSAGAFAGLPLRPSGRAGPPPTRAQGEIDTLIFDIDDTMYAASSGLSDHRMGLNVTGRFMVEKMGFRSAEEGMELWAEYIRRYHSTLKGFRMAEEEGRLPRPFRQEELGEWWAERCDFEKYLPPNPAMVEALSSLQREAGLKLVAFTNAPRKYAIRCLEHMRVKELFDDGQIFAVEDVLPACKPERAAFQQVLDAVGSAPERSVMFEDSMKNIRACGELGIRTVLVQEDGEGARSGEAMLLGDAPVADDPAVGAAIGSLAELRERLPCLWERRFPC